MTRRMVENRERSLGYPGFVTPVFTKESKPLGKKEKITRAPRDCDLKIMTCDSPKETCAYLKVNLRERAKDWYEVLGYAHVQGEETDFEQLKHALKESFPIVRKNRNWKNAGVIEQQNDRRDTNKSAYRNRPQGNNVNQGFENRNHSNRHDHRFENRGGRNQFGNRGPNDNFKRGD
ncbi:hypothetical protein TNCV_3418541 [Trichonephila clavipes]|nr:hypothetical protein TNCV_3418541 [Trichonephila clavipes]